MTVWPDRPQWTHPRPKSSADWYRIQNLVATDTTSIYVYGEIGGWGVCADSFVAELSVVGSTKINVHLNSPGGDVWDGIAILEALRHHPASVTVYVDSLAASAASVIAMAGDRIIMGRQAQMMIHDARCLMFGDAAELRSLADLLDKCSDNIASVYAERSGTSADQWRAAMRAETWYSAQEAVDAGLADEVAPVVERNPPESKVDNSAYAPPIVPTVDLSELVCSAIRKVVG